MIKKSYTTFPFTVVHEFCLKGFFAFTDDFDFRDDFLKESSLLQRSPQMYSNFSTRLNFLRLYSASPCPGLHIVRRAACLTHSPKTSPCPLTNIHLDNDPPLYHSFYPGTDSSKHLQLSEMLMAVAESFSLTSVQNYAGHVAARSNSKGQDSNCSLTDAARTSPFCHSRKRQVVPQQKERMNPKSHQAVFFKAEPAEHYCISPSLALYKRVLHKKTLNFQGIEGTSQQFCAHCPYLTEE